MPFRICFQTRAYRASILTFLWFTYVHNFISVQSSMLVRNFSEQRKLYQKVNKLAQFIYYTWLIKFPNYIAINKTNQKLLEECLGEDSIAVLKYHFSSFNVYCACCCIFMV